MSEFRWRKIKDKDDLEAFYRSILPELRRAARDLGYSLLSHGSLRRDLDLVAIPWVEAAVPKEVLVRAIHQAACGLHSQTYQWEEKPHGRSAACFPICWPEWETEEKSLGHIDLSVMPRLEKEEL